MTTQTLKHFAVSSALLGLLLTASLAGAQAGIVRRMPRKRAGSSARQAVVRPSTTPGSTSYTFTLLNFPGTLSTLAEGINLGATSSAMKIVGGINLDDDAVNGNGETQGGFLARVSGAKIFSETYEALNDPHIPVYQGVLGLNDSGDIVGTYLDSSGEFHAYEKVGAKFSDIDVTLAGANNTTAYGINNAGGVVGSYEDASGLSHGFTLVGGTYTSIDYPGAIQTAASGINSSGEIVGEYGDDSGWHGFLLSGGTYTSFDFSGGATETWANAINDSGNIVGFYCLTEECVGDLSGAQGFLLSGGTFTTIAVPGEVYTQALGINNKGQIVGFYQDAAGLIGSFLATP